jgi:STE24 endopeptidase
VLRVLLAAGALWLLGIAAAASTGSEPAAGRGPADGGARVPARPAALASPAGEAAASASTGVAASAIPAGGGGQPVAVPEPSAKALRYYRSGNALWAVNVAWGLGLPALWLFSGGSARLRAWAERRGRRWPLVLVLFFAVYTLVNFVLSLPLDYYEGFVREHAYGLSTQTFGKWLADALKSLALGLAGGAATLWLPYLLLRRSPRRWWLYSGLAAVPFLFFVLLVAPVWIEPLFNRFGPMQDKALEHRIASLAARAGIPGSRIFEVDKSVDTTAVNAYVDGFLGTERIVLWDTLLAKLSPPQVLFVVGHEMGHYVLGHAWQGIAFYSVLIVAALYVVHCTAGGLIVRWRQRFGVGDLADPASLPLLELLLSAVLLVLSPAALGFSRHLEHEADTFGLELTRDNRAAATAFIQLQQTNLSIPRPGRWYKLWRSSHPPLGERIDFCNRYRPWDQGEPLRYGHLFKDQPPGPQPP